MRIEALHLASSYVTSCNTTMRNDKTHDPSELGDLERELLELVWQTDGATADDLRLRLERPLKDSTIRTVLRRLEEKGYLTHSLDQRTFIYRSTQTRDAIAARAVRRIADWFCNGSMEALLVGMVDSKELNQTELRKLSERLANSRKAGRQ